MDFYSNSLSLIYSINVGMYLLLYYLLFAGFCLQTMVLLTQHFFNETPLSTAHIWHLKHNSLEFKPSSVYSNIPAHCLNNSKKKHQTQKPKNKHQAPRTEETVLNFFFVTNSRALSAFASEPPASSPLTGKANAIKENVPFFFYPFSSFVSF